MRQAIMTAPGTIEFRDVPAPSPAPGHVLLRILRIGVCGSDVHVNHGKHPYTKYPVVQGHEFSAIIESVGPGVSNLRPGQKVTSMPQIVCGQCPPCRRGDYHICDHLRVEGFQAPGCAQDLFPVPADRIILLPDDFTPEQGALVEPTAVAVHATSRAGNLARQNVVVLGAGPIGNLVGQVARASGANVLITDLSDFRLEVAARCGLTLTSNAAKEPLPDAVKRAFNGQGFSVALECVGAETTISAAVSNIAKGGTIVAVGVFAEKPRIDLGLVQDRELRILGTLMYKRQDYEQAVHLIASAQVITLPLESRHFPFAQYADAYQYIDQQADKCVKVFIDL
ncbi:MAG: alcohol dehydrogenase catalytic domain-containing protein [Planctomycetota bacterium]|nr:alcohol dehydrogenase catalytic domain-containing protein [Planctomycetota bacterium]